ncbi:MAG: GatB/YqeY domain-containing protein [Candidatus Absconditabacterales bacterium]
MTLLERITNDYKEAMKARDTVKKSVLNFVLAQAKNKKIEIQKELEDIDIIGLIKKEIKMILETIGFLEKSDKADKEGEILIELQKKALLEFYLPATLTKEKTRELIEKLMKELNITDLKTQRGLLMKELMVNHKSEIDGSLVNEVINEMIA